MALLPANCTILFEVPTGTTSTNALGSPSVDTESVVLTAFLKPKKDNAYQSPESRDGQLSGQKVAGYLISPSLMPQGVQSEQAGRCTFWRVGMGDGFVLPEVFEDAAELASFEADNADKVALRGEFFWEANIPGAFGVEAILGDRLAGRLVLRTVWADGI
ncbi:MULTISPECIES: hypothetical protein [Cyanophyceae]|uniref:hypothetical protein n=1 Tax=Cyanophyceae TaxID=3028117 RepID=UPI001689ECA6|nr:MULTISPECIES: hypothetical protein [Cyanophyceae]MBD1918854.1 hypothetical protein [Phormidium sp. FACHB-77]MBD2033303.1 hypothetical protein [Phormidium sp. FACHB-322]MBD2053764.1 hypothetical protein [Leptolyngbya sp. FACHB-60]